jgi:divalent metal cation (Fe/Co/Zn/Cd) transporter
MAASVKTASSVTSRAVGLEYATILLATGEAAGALVSGVMAGSVALIAFGTDSVIEMMSALIVLSQLRAMVRGEQPSASAVHRAHRTIAVLFFSLVLYVIVAAVVALVGARHASENGLGLIVCIASLGLMPSLALAKRRSAFSLTGGGFTTIAKLMRADASETALCAILSLSTLVGIALASRAAWWWADPVASLVVVAFAVREGREAWTCDPVGTAR